MLTTVIGGVVFLLAVFTFKVQRWPEWVRLITVLPSSVWYLWLAYSAPSTGAMGAAVIIAVLPPLALGIEAWKDRGGLGRIRRAALRKRRGRP